ncbi:redox-sensitive transcriptional activator SoxR [Modestobacter sp. I12A-02628]|uniref:Redox-sensitive transcriptional activator SoxR n=1 Tax=Goekera deserti TaxID=2497753 RepID=A0A7K3WFT5_9ACTN|nr:redox-sensitive transcriptional activator SoxR [Goekera deserti]MPR00085.1 redox-sensitive transcriptional activator SoxR [Goekera deserti]NDI49864.1 redox-sensitive transcriptional activator SoxR [Goekera deserti]NEL55226.1 redox-sensitive transcriptional activator SoxR [Goekera deserti]
MELTVGEVARRSGVSVAALRFYEQQGLISSRRTPGNQRRYERGVLRRLAFVAAAQRVGLTLAQVRAALDTLPAGRTPTRADWTALSTGWRALVDARIAELQRLREDLDGCIGCGCLSLPVCALYNPGDQAGAEAPGSRWLRRALDRPGQPADSGSDPLAAVPQPGTADRGPMPAGPARAAHRLGQ